MLRNRRRSKAILVIAAIGNLAWLFSVRAHADELNVIRQRYVDGGSKVQREAADFCSAG